MKRNLVYAALAILALLAIPASAQEAWPARPVKVIVASDAGGGTDVYARLLAQALGSALKQQFVVENKPGAGGNIGADAVAKSAPDGYTLLVAAAAAVTVNQALYKNIPYDAERDFAPVTRGVTTPMAFCVAPSVPVKSLGELVALGRREPGKLAYGTAGMGTGPHLGVRRLEELTGARFMHVPYKGLGPAYQGLLSGQVQLILTPVATALSLIRSGKAVPLAVSDRTNLLPSTPTIAEAGFAELEISNSFSVLAPTGTPAPIIQRLSAEIARAMKSSPLADKLESMALVPAFDTPEQFAAQLKKDRQIWNEFIRRSGIAQQQ